MATPCTDGQPSENTPPWLGLHQSSLPNAAKGYPPREPRERTPPLSPQKPRLPSPRGVSCASRRVHRHARAPLVGTLDLQSDMLGVALLATLVARAAAHGAVSWPRPRNAIDHEDAAAQANATYPYRGQACPSPDGPGRTTGVLGQACFWFSNGCAIGCASCDGKSRGPIPSSGDPRWRRKFDLCGAAARATVCDPRLRTVNTGAACGSEEDWYYYSPWRAPGAAPVFDACGMAGGTPVAGKFGGHYSATAHAKQGDLGSKTLRKAAPSVALEAETSLPPYSAAFLLFVAGVTACLVVRYSFPLRPRRS